MSLSLSLLCFYNYAIIDNKSNEMEWKKKSLKRFKIRSFIFIFIFMMDYLMKVLKGGNWFKRWATLWTLKKKYKKKINEWKFIYVWCHYHGGRRENMREIDNFFFYSSQFYPSLVLHQYFKLYVSYILPLFCVGIKFIKNLRRKKKNCNEFVESIPFFLIRFA